jgi:hypothetical protein
MIVISLNVRGVGGAPKFLALKRLFDLVKPDIVMIQETMVDGNKAREVFSKIITFVGFLCGGFKGFIRGSTFCLESKKN